MELTKSNYQSDGGATYDRSRGTRANKMPGSREPEGTSARGQIRVQLIGGHSSLQTIFRTRQSILFIDDVQCVEFPTNVLETERRLTSFARGRMNAVETFSHWNPPAWNERKTTCRHESLQCIVPVVPPEQKKKKCPVLRN